MAKLLVVLGCLAVSTVSYADTPSDVANTILKTQVGSLADPSAFLGTVASDAVIVSNGNFAFANESNAHTLLATLAEGSVLQPVVTEVHAGRAGDVVWFSADVVLVHMDPIAFDRYSTRRKTGIRLFEVALADGKSWRVAAMAFSSLSGLTATGDSLDAKPTGPITTLASSPSKLDDALRADALLVSGSPGELGDLAVGADAHRMLAPLRDRSVKVRGVTQLAHTDWTLGLANIEVAPDSHAIGGKPTPMLLLILALKSGERWRVAALHASTSVKSRSSEELPARPRIDEVPLESRSISP